MAPIRPNPEDVSVKNGGPGAYRWYQGHTADQAERDAMELTRIGVAFPEAVLLARQAGALDAATRAVAGMARTFYTFLPVYVSRTIVPRGIWFIGDYGHYYNDEALALSQVRAGLVGRMAPPTTAAQLVALDLSLVGGKFVAGNPTKRPDPTEPYNDPHSHVDVIDTSKPAVPLDATQLALLQAAEDAHENHGDVRGTQLAFEASAGPGQRHFFQIPPFTGAVDPGWAPAEVAKLTQLTDVFHQGWSAGLRASDAGATYVNGLLHLMAHVMRAIGTDDQLKVRLPAPGVKIENRPIETTRMVLARLP